MLLVELRRWRNAMLKERPLRNVLTVLSVVATIIISSAVPEILKYLGISYFGQILDMTNMSNSKWFAVIFVYGISSMFSNILPFILLNNKQFTKVSAMVFFILAAFWTLGDFAAAPYALPGMFPFMWTAEIIGLVIGLLLPLLLVGKICRHSIS